MNEQIDVVAYRIDVSIAEGHVKTARMRASENIAVRIVRIILRRSAKAGSRIVVAESPGPSPVVAAFNVAAAVRRRAVSKVVCRVQISLAE